MNNCKNCDAKLQAEQTVCNVCGAVVKPELNNQGLDNNQANTDQDADSKSKTKKSWFFKTVANILYVYIYLYNSHCISQHSIYR